VLALGDLTASLLDPSRAAVTTVVAREPGVLAGRLCVLETFRQVDPAVDVDWQAPDGTAVEAGSVVGEVRGPLASILTAERTALNFLCHLSGVATATRRVVDAVGAANPSTRVVDTRKTLPGLRALQKAAVRAGGGANHRASLSDGVLLKDNHLAVMAIREAVARARAAFPMRTVEVECDEEGQAMEAAEAGADVIMLDNMAPEAVARTVGALREAGFGGLVEVSGRLDEASAAAFAAAGADLVSLGALTHSARAMDLALDFGRA